MLSTSTLDFIQLQFSVNQKYTMKKRQTILSFATVLKDSDKVFS